VAKRTGGSEPLRARWLSVAPGMPTTDMERTLRDYARMGFAARTYEGGEFAILTRDGVELHFSLRTDHDPRRTAACIYVRVEDVDALFRELTAAGVALRREPHDTDHRTRELPYIDPDNNMIIFGSPMR
jgi:predicted enzyme related to lactoylglutathione lyase